LGTRRSLIVRVGIRGGEGSPPAGNRSPRRLGCLGNVPSLAGHLPDHR
jgi:hypothetical protein